MTTSYQLITKTALLGLKTIKQNGQMPSGHNGPYNDKETPVRNTGHWLIIFSKAYQITKNKNFKTVAGQLAKYLLTKKAKPHNASFHHRFTPQKDKCNGLIGQAWTIESLIEASRLLKDSQYISLAANVFTSHKFNYYKGLWHRLEIDGKTLSIDSTLNHQIWFAAIGSEINNKTIHSQVKLFLDRLSNNITVLNNGLIFHPIISIWKKQTIISRIKNMALGTYHPEKINNKLIYKSIGYHSFNLYALAILKNKFPRHIFWQSKSFKQTIKYCFSDQYKKDLIGNKYGFPYNPVGFEMPFIIDTFSKLNMKEKNSLSAFWLKQQIKNNQHKNLDVPTQTARIYELSRSSNVTINYN